MEPFSLLNDLGSWLEGGIAAGRGGIDSCGFNDLGDIGEFSFTWELSSDFVRR